MGVLEKIRKLLGFQKKYILEDVFTPTSSAKINYVARPGIEREISSAIKIPGTQLILYGHSGGGKTTLIRNVLDKLGRKFIITPCITGITIDELILQAFDKLNPYYKSETTNKNALQISTSLKATYYKIEANISSDSTEEHTETHKRALPVQLTFERLGEFLGAAECVWIIEDFHKVDEYEKQRLSDIMKAFVDIANDYTKVKIVAIGAVSSAREVVNYNKDIKSRVAEISIPLLSDTELNQIIVNGAKLLNIEFEERLIYDTKTHSNSLGSLCHQLCYKHCEQLNISETKDETLMVAYDIFENSIKSYVSQKSDTFQQKLDRALKQRAAKFENVKLILNAILNIKKEGVTYNEILTKIHDWQPDYPQSNLTVYLKPLTTSEHDEIIRYDANSGKYSFSDPFFKAYCKMALEKIDETKPKNEKLKIDMDKLISNFNIIFSEINYKSKN